jgi:pSer/pThr/pTyr-binding forkhead associated (FHA) protein
MGNLSGTTGQEQRMQPDRRQVHANERNYTASSDYSNLHMNAQRISMENAKINRGGSQAIDNQKNMIYNNPSQNKGKPETFIVKKSMENPTRKSMENPTRNSMENQMGNPMRNSMENPMENSIEYPMRNSRGNSMENSMRNSKEYSTGNSMEPRSFNKIVLLNEELQTLMRWEIAGKAALVIGKNTEKESVDIDLSNSTYAQMISKQHAVLNYTPRGWCIEDIDSKNGTRVKRGNEMIDVALAGSVELMAGDIMYIAMTMLQLQ